MKNQYTETLKKNVPLCLLKELTVFYSQREETHLKISKQERDLQKVRNETYFNNRQYRRAILKEAIIDSILSKSRELIK